MKKDDFIHLHGLFAEVREYAQEQNQTIETPNYDEIETGPMSLHKSKNSHKEAVFILAEDLATALGEESESGDGVERMNSDDEADTSTHPSP